jgi:hypothetical protein
MQNVVRCVASIAAWIPDVVGLARRRLAEFAQAFRSKRCVPLYLAPSLRPKMLVVLGAAV